MSDTKTLDLDIISEEPISERLKMALELRGMKPIDLSKKTGIPKSSISQYILGQFEPKTDRIGLMAHALNVDPVWLCGFPVPMEVGALQRKAERDADLVRAFNRAPESIQDGIMALLKPYME